MMFLWSLVSPRALAKHVFVCFSVLICLVKSPFLQHLKSHILQKNFSDSLDVFLSPITSIYR